MIENLSNHIKALLVLEDITEGIAVMQDKCFTLQHFEYRTCHSRNEMGMPYGPAMSVTLQFSVKTLSGDGGGKYFYQRLQSNNVYFYTFVFNATFDEDNRLSGYEDAMVASGYVVDVEECFCSASVAGAEAEQMLMNVKLLLRSITYIGRNLNKTLSVID